MLLSTLLRLQISYVVLGIGYNTLSLIFFSTYNRALTNNSPILGAATIFLYGLFLIPGFLGKHEIYRVLMFIAFIGLGYSGVIKHLLNFDNLNLYYSLNAWVIAILINFFGVILNFIAFTGKYK